LNILLLLAVLVVVELPLVLEVVLAGIEQPQDFP
jgi:hypothetical protein